MRNPRRGPARGHRHGHDERDQHQNHERRSFPEARIHCLLRFVVEVALVARVRADGAFVASPTSGHAPLNGRALEFMAQILTSA